MTESLLTALMKLFAILASLNKDISHILSRNFVEAFLKIQFNKKIIEQALILFDTEINKLSASAGFNETKRTSYLSVKILTICNEINSELPVRSKFIVLISLLQFSRHFENKLDSTGEFRQTISDTVKTIADYLRIEDNEYTNCNLFINGKFFNISSRDRLVVMSNEGRIDFSRINHIHKEHLRGQLFFLKLKQAGLIIFYYTGNDRLMLGGEQILSGHIYIFAAGTSMKGENISPVYLSDIEAAFLSKGNYEKISLEVENIEFMFMKGKGGIHPFSFSAESGSLTGIMGGSGAGKSTLLKVMTGAHKLKSGKILFNGHEFYPGRKDLKGLIGYVPQDDLLIEELTVYDNLFYNAKLCLGGQENKQIEETVYRVLNQLDLFHIKDLKVGSPLNKFISGGQRKRLNIALELVKEPLVLFADEPTTGLSSMDSENVMQLLKGLTLQGRVVIITIHQPSPELFKMLNKLLVLDIGGYPVYFGDPLDSISYFKNIANRIGAKDIECPYCGNIRPDEILEVVEAKHVNEFGEFTAERIITPEKWYERFLENFQITRPADRIITALPSTRFSVPRHISQFITYSKRNFISKLADKQYVLFSLLISPFLAAVLSFFTKYVSGTSGNSREYLFINNVNLPAYIFMSVIVALFTGLIISAEDIFKDRKILEREKFLNLSRTAYINSKVSFFLALTALQVFLFVIIGNNILEIKAMTFSYWLVLFSTGCFAIILGLNISSALKSAVAIYITIPFILVPLILLAGVIVKYDKLHYSLSSGEYVPVVGDLMVSRWAYEALIVNQFMNNGYQRHFYRVDRESANASWEINFIIPELFNKISDYQQLAGKDPNSSRTTETLFLIRNTINSYDEEIRKEIPDFNIRNLNSSIDINRLRNLLSDWKSRLIEKTKILEKRKDMVIECLLKLGMTREDLIKIRKMNYNKSIAELVLNTNEMTKITVNRGKLVRMDTPIYQYPQSKFGRSRFYSGTKRIGSMEFNTLWFNTSVIWLMTLVLYFNLVSDLLRKIIAFLQGRYNKRHHLSNS